MLMVTVREIFLTIFPIFPMLWLMYTAQSFCALTKTGKIKKAKIEIEKISDLRPKNLRKKVIGTGIKSASIDSFINAYQKVFYAGCIYIITCLAHFVLIVSRFVYVFQNYCKTTGNVRLLLVLRFACISLVLSYIFFIEPVGKSVWGKKKFESLYETIMDGIAAWAKLVVACSIEFAISFLMLWGYVFCAESFLDSCTIGEPFWTKLAMLMVYQYFILAVISTILRVILNKIYSRLNGKFHAGAWLEPYTKCNNLYNALKNGTYISLVLISALAETSNSPVAAIIGVLFLVDTYIDKCKDNWGLN